jgi:hypothetical protein
MPYTTTRINKTSSVRSDVIRDLWNTVKEMPQAHKFSYESVMKYMMSKTMNNEGEDLNATSKYTFGRVRLCEWENFDKQVSQQYGNRNAF